MKMIEENGRPVFFLSGRIDATNAAEFERELTDAISAAAQTEPILDADGLEYISSAGLRVLMRLRKTLGKEVTVRNVSPEVYEIFDVTGFTSLLKVEKAMRFVSVAGLQRLGGGMHSTVYRLDGETVIKVVRDMTLEAIRAEMQVSKTVFFYGIPTAISYDVVRTEEGYGEIYEMFRAGILPAAVMAEPERREEYLRRFVDVFRQIHGVELREGELGSVRERYLQALDALGPYLAQEEIGLLRRLILAVPDRHTFVHGDYHMSNVMLQDGELVLIDVGEAGYGHPLLDFAQTGNAYETITRRRPQDCERVLGLSMEEACYVRDNLFPMYFGDTGEALERKLTAVKAVTLLRGVLVAFLQGWDHLPADFSARIDNLRAFIFPQIDRLCEIIQNDF